MGKMYSDRTILSRTAQVLLYPPLFNFLRTSYHRLLKFKQTIRQNKWLSLPSDTVLFWQARLRGPWFQTHDFAPNIVGNRVNRIVEHSMLAATWRKYLREKGVSLKNSRCIDFGSSEGRWSVFCADLGASQVTGIEYNKEFVQKANWVLNRLDGDYRKKIEFNVGNIVEYPYKGTYDFGMVSGLFYHLSLEEQSKLVEILKKHFKCGIIGTMIYVGENKTLTPKELAQYDGFSYTIEGPIQEGLAIGRKGNEGPGVAYRDLMVVYPYRSYLMDLFKNHGLRIEQIPEPELTQEMYSYRRDHRIQNGHVIGYHDFFFENPDL